MIDNRIEYFQRLLNFASDSFNESSCSLLVKRLISDKVYASGNEIALAYIFAALEVAKTSRQAEFYFLKYLNDFFKDSSKSVFTDKINNLIKEIKSK